MGYGITASGFVRKPLATIIEERKQALRDSGVYGSNPNFAYDSPLGQIVKIGAEQEAYLWELLEEVYNAFNPNNASGVQLENSCLLVGIKKLGATKSTVPVTLTGIPGKVVPSGSQASVADSGLIFKSTASATFDGGGLISATWESVDYGAIQAELGFLTNILTPVTGWTSIINTQDADLGSEIETDAELRVRRENSLAVSGGGTVPSVRARMIDEIDNLTACTVIENTTDLTDSEGRPPHSIHVIVRGGSSADIAAKIWEIKGGGIALHGLQSLVVTDDDGTDHIIKWDTATDVDLWVHITIQATTGFDEGTKQKTYVDIISVENLTTYVVQINGVDYSYTSGAVATKSAIISGLISAINSGAYVPVAASPDSSKLMLLGDFYGYVFAVAVDSKMSFANSEQATGDCRVITEAVVAWADAGFDVGDSVLPHLFSTPVNTIANVWDIDSIEVDTVGPPVNTASFFVLSYQLPSVDSSRVTVEVV